VAGYTGWFLGQTTNWGTASNTFGIARLSGGLAQAKNGLFIASNGNVGIGAPYSSAKLHIYGGGAPWLGPSSNMIAFEYQGDGYKHFITSFHSANVNSSENRIDFWLNNTTQGGSSTAGTGNVNMVSVTARGLGINCNAPAATLDVKGTANFSSNVTFSGNMSVFNSNITGYYNGSGISYGAGYYNTLVHSLGNVGGYMIADYGFQADTWNFTTNAFTNNGAWVVPNAGQQSSRMAMSGAGIGFYVSAGGGTAPTTQRVGIGNGVGDFLMNVYGRAFMSSIAFKSTYNNFINGAPVYGLGMTSSGVTGAGGQPLVQICGYEGINFIGGSAGWSNGASHMAIVNSYVGVNCNAPGYQFTVNGRMLATSISVNSGAVEGDLVNGSPSYGMGRVTSGLAGLGTWTVAAGQNPLQLANYYGINFVGGPTGWAAGVSHMCIVDGKVGIGLTNPTYPLHVNGSGFFNAYAGIGVQSANSVMRMLGDGGGASFISANAYINTARTAWLPDNSGFGGTNYSYLIEMSPPYSASGIRFHSASYPQGYGTIPGWDLNFTIYTDGNATLRKKLTQDSDIRLKENIVTIDSCLDKVKALRGVYYTRKDSPGERQIGFIAQEVEQILPEVVLEDLSEEKIKSIAYQNIVPVLVEAMKEQQTMITTLQSQVASQQSTITGILARLP
jgi:hypothetical protein